MLKREGQQLYALVNKWRDEANELADRNRRGCYIDHTSRVIVEAQISELRRCARNLKRRVDDMYQRTH